MLKDPAEGALVAWMHDVQSSCQVKELVLISAAYIFCEYKYIPSDMSAFINLK